MIRILPSHLVNQIAAGEVIERPSSALKELIENAIDAGATAIDIHVRDGGKSLLQVTDNGKGMTADELSLSVLRHATSKLPDEDLFHLSFLGFRGEALPSIGAVSRLTITSRTKDSPSAMTLKVEGGTIFPPSPAAGSIGTIVSVRDLFYKTPARLKFLKSETSELSAIIDTIERFALCYPSIAFSLYDGDKKKLDFKVCPDPETRYNDVLRKDFIDNTLPFSAERETISLSGRTSVPTFTSRNSLSEYLFVNKRPVKDRQIFGAIKAAYDGFMPHTAFPHTILFITIAPELVDVNVHPAKAEIRFKDAAYVRSLIIQTLRQALSSTPGKSSSTLSDQLKQTLSADFNARKDNLELSFPVSFPSAFAEKERTPDFTPERPSFLSSPFQTRTEEISDEPLGQAIVQIGLTYILARNKDGLILVDQHAAHERLIYEKIRAGFDETSLSRQLLLIPEIVTLSAKDIAALLPLSQELLAFGFALDAFGTDAVMVREVPAFLGQFDIEQTIKDLAELARENDIRAELSRYMKDVCAVMACHSSIRKGRAMTVYEMNALLRDMEKTPTAAQCIHGRPTYVRLDVKDLDRLFQR